MDVAYEERHDQLRARVRRLIETEGPRMRIRTGSRVPENAEQEAQLRRWCAALYRESLLGQHWPVRWGGREDVDPLDSSVIAEEIARAHLPKGVGFAPMAAHALLGFGTEEQQGYFLPRIRSSEHIWCQLFSEPGAGSDLAGLRTEARRDGDHYELRGQKVWNTHAQWADYGLLLARTDPAGPRHHNLSLFALDMRTPGVDPRPITEITGDDDFNEVFLDGVRIPVSARIGPEHQGWAVARSVLAHERGGIGEYTVMLEEELDRLVALARTVRCAGVPAAQNGEVRDRLAGFAARISAGKAAGYRRLTRSVHGVADPAGAPMGKLVFSELYTEMVEYGLRLLGEDGIYAPLPEGDPEQARWVDDFLYSRAYTLGGGTSDIMRNLLAERVLAMPKDPVTR